MGKIKKEEFFSIPQLYGIFQDSSNPFLLRDLSESRQHERLLSGSRNCGNLNNY